MPAYVIGHIHVRDAGKWQDYVTQVGATIAAYGGEVLLRGATAKVFSGAHRFERVVVLRFSDQDAAARWHASPEYQRLIAARDQAADVTLISYNA
jgi:uncharacterized protein (DUF1330 family)